MVNLELSRAINGVVLVAGETPTLCTDSVALDKLRPAQSGRFAFGEMTGWN